MNRGHTHNVAYISNALPTIVTLVLDDFGLRFLFRFNNAFNYLL
jgi:hypothetical protein